MSYGRRRHYRRRRSSNDFAGMVGDSAEIASRLSPEGAVLTGVGGFVLLCFLVPWLLTLWADHNKANMKGQYASLMGKLLDDIFIQRFIHPSELAGIAVLLVCLCIAAWKLFSMTEPDYHDRRSMGTLARILARWFD